MTKRQSQGRHRAPSARTNPLEAISQAVSSNAGSVGRQAAVVAAASGLIVTLGVPGQASAPRDVSAAPVDVINPERVAVQAVAVSAKKADKFEIERATFTAEPKPEPEPVVIAVSNNVTPVSNNAPQVSSDDNAPMTRESRNQTQSNTTQSTNTTAPKTTKKETTTQVKGLSGIAATATKYQGTPYVWGGNSPSGWDCSGFVQYVYKQHGINIARGTSAILGSGQFVRTSNPQPGDLVFQRGGSHVGIYLGGGTMIGAQNPRTGTNIHPVTQNPLYGYYTLAR
ncbi:NlpC/P60 family protein [Glutamicibacter sp. MNS18]|uniref:C40 family peptidase n=1 Tax=Glutamicibacter sp. MNS18 TaxID=2989817 RepID=UPI002236153A|nr:C40 family peptidase [Glutamicibacter sp. MNS18]MCW4466487.1 NlpC/P60 family protein [Glutamicibacter sp. MNS18]